MTSMNVGRFLTALAIALSCVACGPSYMMQVKTPGVAIQPTATEAVVVFMRPQMDGTSWGLTVMDSTRRFLGNAPFDSFFAVRVPAGDHIFVLWAGGTYGLKARVVGGKTYFVAIGEDHEVFQGLTPRSDGWSRLPNELRTLSQYIPDLKAGQAYLDSRGAEANARIAEVTKIFAALPPDTPPAISPDDGIPAGQDIAATIEKETAAKKAPPPPHAAPPHAPPHAPAPPAAPPKK